MTVAEGLAGFATPAGNTTKPAFEALRDEILEDLERAMPVDAVLLNLHGAMIADGYLDAEGELLRCVRERIGPTFHCSRNSICMAIRRSRSSMPPMYSSTTRNIRTSIR